VKKKSNNSWQKDDVSSASNKDMCLEAARRSQTTQIPPLLVPNPHAMPHLLLRYEPHVQMMKRQLSPHQNQRKGLMMLSTPLGISTKGKGRS
jgi:hypothetical protein